MLCDERPTDRGECSQLKPIHSVLIGVLTARINRDIEDYSAVLAYRLTAAASQQPLQNEPALIKKLIKRKQTSI